MSKRLVCFWLFFSVLSGSYNCYAAFSSKDSSHIVAEGSNGKPDVSSIPQSLKEFNSLSRPEKKSRMRELKKAIKEYKNQKKAGEDVNTNTLLLVLISIFIPPLAVYLHEGTINNRFWIDVLLTILGYLLFGFAGIFFLGSLPGIIYALIVILGG